jgi:tetratricopeptide (TPR) repeat protein
MNPDQLCAEAQNHHRAGNLTRAEILYTTALRLNPRHPDSLHLLGCLALSQNQPDRAITLISEAIAEKPRVAAYRESLGLALRAANRDEDAVTAFRHAIRLEKSAFGAHYNLGNALAALGQHAEAAQSFRRAIVINPKFAGAHNNLGNALRAMKDEARAAEAFKAAIAIDPNSVELHLNLAAALAELMQDRQAAAALTQALAIDPSHNAALTSLSLICRRMKHPADAEQALRRGLSIAPDNLDFISELATQLHMLGHREEASTHFFRALRLAPGDYRFYIHVGLWLREIGDLFGSERHFRAGLALAPEEPLLHYGLALTLLSMGRLREGFAEYEWRWQAIKLPLRQTAPVWTGEPDTSRTLLIAAEQGQGDCIQFLRYVPLAAARIRIILEVYGPLRRLFEATPGVAQLFCPGEPEPDHDVFCSLLSLPRVLGLDTSPFGMDLKNPYLRPHVADAARWAARVARLPGPKIGLVWAGSAGFAYDGHRSLSPSLLDQLARDDVTFLSLQKGETVKPGLNMTDWTAELPDFAETAALISNLDLVISVDTAVAHLAGALGKPVWLLNRFDSDWRWLRDGETTAWYPTMRLFRQTSLGDWSSVITAVTTALDDLILQLTSANPHAEAAKYVPHDLAPDPTNVQEAIQLAIARQRAGDPAGAEQALRRAIQFTPTDATLVSDLAILLHTQGRAEDAATQFQTALNLAPNDPKILARHAVWLRDSGDLPASETQFRAAIAQAPNDPLLHYGLSFTLLAAGRLREGFAQQEWRWDAHNIPPPATAPTWTGDHNPNQTLLITSEQGQGDIIQFLRYVPLAAQRMRVALAVYPPLHRLAATLTGVTTLLREGEPLPPHHAVCPLLSLPRALGLDETPLPMDPVRPYLRSDPQSSARWAARLAHLPGRKIGLAWSGAPNFSFDSRRSVPPAFLDSLADENISFVSLQKNPAATPNLSLTDHTADLTDFADTAALIANLDLVISVDTAVAHLAGALGKPIWLLNRFDSDWRWRREGDTSEWYPTLRQFRQQRPGDWPSVIAAVQAALKQPPPPQTR